MISYYMNKPLYGDTGPDGVKVDKKLSISWKQNN